MNVPLIQAVGVLPELLSEVCEALSLDSHMDNMCDMQPSVFPYDPLEESLEMSIASSEYTSVHGDPLEHVQRVDDDILDKMIVRLFESDADCISSDLDTISANEFTYSLQTQEDSKPFVTKEMDITRSPSPVLPSSSTDARDRKRSKDTTDWYEKPSRRRTIRKGKRSRAPAIPWTEEEHQRFEESLELFGRNWEQCAAYIGTRRAQLVRSHAQKHLIKLWKLGKPLPKKVAESGTGYTLSGKPLLADSASARSYLTKIPCPDMRENLSRSK